MQQPFSSPSFDQHPASVGMVRKRTFQDSQSGVSSSPGYSACDSSPSSAAFTDYQYLSSPHTSISTLASSPMSRNASTQSCFSTFSPQDYDIDNSPQSSLYAPFPCFSPTQDSLLADFAERPGMKRRKTMPDVSHLSPSSPVKSRDVASPFTPRGSGKDGEDVWPQMVEEHFQTALRLLPRLGRKKLIIQGKPCGRNELIADYILRHTGKVRSRKQVSSHIQVLKNLRKDDEEFMYLVSDPVEGEDQFLPGNAELFFGKNGMASPFAPPVFLERSLSASNVPHHPPIDLSSDPSRLDPAFAHPPHSHLHPNLPSPQSLHSPFIMQPSPSSATTPTSGITRGMQGMSVAVPRSPGAIPAACPIAPSFMNMIAPTTNGENGHIYARLDAPSGPTRSAYLEDLPLWDKRYARIPAMNDHLPCQFLHVNLPLSIPGVNGAVLDQPLQTQLRVTSVQALPLTAVTSIYCHGDSVITYEDTLNPIPLDASSTHPLGHQHFYDVPFGSDFWTMLLRGGHDGMSEASLRKSTKDRQGLADMLPGFSVIQEFVVPSENGVAPAPGDENSLSPGSSMGDVVLVVLYDLEVSRGSRAQSGELSFVSVRRTSAPSPPTSHSMQLPNPHSLPLPIHDFDAYSLPTVPNVPQLIVPSHYTHHDDSLETARPHSISPHKPNLSLHIPPPSQFTRPNPQSNLSSSQPSPSNLPNGPITPWGQVVHTPTHPPPVAPPQSAQADAQRDRSRLEAAWRANAANTNNRWDLDSPALYPPPHPNLYGNAQVQAHSGPSNSSSSLSSFSMDRRSVSTPVLSMSSHQSRPTNLLPPLPSPSTLAQNFATSSSSFSPSPLSFAPQQTDYLNSKPIQRREEPRVVPTTIEREKKPVASKLEQDAFFSNLLGSTTRYTVTS